MELTDQQLMRYSRQLFLPEIDIYGQTRLLNSDIVIIGAGGLGSISAPLLCAAGVGKIILIDDDHIELSNLPRQLSYREDDIGALKVERLKNRLSELNSDCRIEVITTRLSEDKLEQVLVNKDIVLDGTDNFASRYQINKACHKTKTPLLSAAVTQFAGQLVLFDYQAQTPCYECLYSDTSDEQNNCAENGVLGAAASIVASMQALEVTKYLAGMDCSVRHKLLSLDLKTQRWHSAKVAADPACPVCKITI